MWESRVAPLSGLLFALLLAASFLLDSNTEFMPPPDGVVTYLGDGPVRIMSGAYLRLLAAVTLIWFSGSLHRSMGRLDDDRGRLSLLAFGGGIVAAVLIAIGAAATVAAAERIWVVGTIDPGAAAALNDLAGISIGNAAPLGLGVMIGAAGIAQLRTASGARWPGWAGVGIGLGLLSPFAWLVLVLALVWIPVTGIWMYREHAEPVSTTVE